MQRITLNVKTIVHNISGEGHKNFMKLLQIMELSGLKYDKHDNITFDFLLIMYSLIIIVATCFKHSILQMLKFV